MPRPRLLWFKLHTRILHSSINYELSLEEFGCFIKLLAFCAELGGSGFIADGEGRPLPHTFVASHLTVPIGVLSSTLKKCQATNRIKENSNGIEILKWKEYQSEYQRQKPYRDAKKFKTGPALDIAAGMVCADCGYMVKMGERSPTGRCPKCGGAITYSLKEEEGATE